MPAAWAGWNDATCCMCPMCMAAIAEEQGRAAGCPTAPTPVRLRSRPRPRRVCAAEGGSCQAATGLPCCAVAGEASPLQCTRVGAARLCARPPALPSQPFGKRRVEGQTTGAGGAVQLKLSLWPPASTGGLDFSYSVRLTERPTQRWPGEGTVYTLQGTKVRWGRAAAWLLCLRARHDASACQAGPPPLLPA